MQRQNNQSYILYVELGAFGFFLFRSFIVRERPILYVFFSIVQKIYFVRSQIYRSFSIYFVRFITERLFSKISKNDLYCKNERFFVRSVKKLSFFISLNQPNRQYMVLFFLKDTIETTLISIVLYWILNTGYWILNTGYWILNTGY